MAPKISKAKTSCLDKIVCYEPSVWMRDFKKEDQVETAEILQRNGWMCFATSSPSFLLKEEVNQFYEVLIFDEVLKQYRSSINISTNSDFSNYEKLHLNVTKLVR